MAPFSLGLIGFVSWFLAGSFFVNDDERESRWDGKRLTTAVPFQLVFIGRLLLQQMS